MKPTIHIFCLALLLCIVSCSEPYQPASQDFVPDVVIIAELDFDKRPALNISTTYNDDVSLSYPYLNDGGGTLTNITSGQSLVLRSAEKNVGNWVQTAFQYEEGDKIALTTDFSKIGLAPTYAETKVPVRGQLLKLSDATKGINNTQRQIFTFKVTFDKLSPGDHYHFMPYVTVDPILIENTYLTIDSTTFSNNQDLYYPIHSNGILIDNSMIDDTEITFTASAPMTSFIPSEIYLRLLTVSDDYIEYHKSVSEQQEATFSPFDPNPQTYSNIERGQGIFSAYISSLDTISVR